MKTAIAIIVLALTLTGCAGYVTKPDGTKIPAAVAIQEAAAKAHEACPPEIAYIPVPDGIEKCEPGDDACHFAKAIVGVSNSFAKVEHAEEQQEGLATNCHAQVAKEVDSFNEALETKYKQGGNATQTALRWVGGYLIVDTVTSNTVPQQGDTNVDTVNVNANSGSGGSGSEGAGGTSGSVTQNVNIGPGKASQATDSGSLLEGEKATIGDGNQDNDSPNTSLF